MRSGKSKTEFFHSMKKKPALQKILDNIDTMTWQEIDEEKQPKWIKDILYKMKFDGNLLTPTQIAGMMSVGINEPDTREYASYRYIGETRMVDNVEIFNNELLLMIDNDTIKIGHMEIKKELIEHELQLVEKIETVADYVTRKLDDDWERLCPGEDRVVDQMGRTIGGVKVQFRKIE